MRSYIRPTSALSLLLALLAITTAACTTPSRPAPAPGVDFLLVDETTSMTQGLNAVGQSRAHVSIWLTGSHRGDLVACYFLDQKSSRPHLICDCVSGGQGAEARIVDEGPAAVQRRFAAQVLTPIDRALIATATPVSGGINGCSPIVESLYFLTRSTAWATTHGQRRLCIVSDLLQASALTSFYTRPELLVRPDGKPRFPQWLADLHGADIQIELVLRDADAPLQGPRLQAQWTAYFKTCGAASVTWNFVVVAQPS